MRTTIFVLALAAAVLAGCASTPSAGGGPDDVYLGSGRGASLGEAVNAAKMDAVRNAVIDLIGERAEAAQAAKLDDVLYSTRNPNAFVYNETMETLRRDGSLADGDLRYEIRIRVNVPAVKQTLEANGITANVAAAGSAGGAGTGSGGGGAGSGAGDGSGSGGGASAAGDVSDATTTQPLASADGFASDSTAEVTPAERRFIARYVDTMTYMVFFADTAAAGLPDRDFVMRSAVNQANSYLVSEGHLVVDAGQVETLREDQRLVYEEQAGQELSLLQWVARRLNADVYLELDARVDGRKSGTSYYATADVTINMYETSTGQILGSINRRSAESFSRTSEEDAAVNAVQSTVYQAMPFAVDMAEQQMARALTRGIRYELMLQQPPDARTVSRFRNAMRSEVREIATVNQSPEEILLEVFFLGTTDELVDLVFAVSDRVAGFENINLVVTRGRSITFDVGF